MHPSRLELPSAYGDQTLAGVRFVAHGAPAEAAQAIEKLGFTFAEGRAVVSTNLVHAHSQAGEGGTIVLLAVPAEFHVGYGVFTTAYIVRDAKLVTGAPLRYAAARRELAFYLEQDTEAARRRIELETAGGASHTAQAEFVVDTSYVLGSLRAIPGLLNLLARLEVSAHAFEPIDFAGLEGALTEMVEMRQPAQAVLAPSLVRAMLVGTAESVVLSRLRTMRWQGLALLGYNFREGREDVVVTRVQDVGEQRRNMDQYGRMLASSSMFTGELAWLKVYALHQLDLMRVELDGAELEEA